MAKRKICEVRCAILDEVSRGIAEEMLKLKIRSPGPNVLGMSYEDLSFNFIDNKNWEVVCD